MQDAVRECTAPVGGNVDVIELAAERLIEITSAAGFREIPLSDARNTASLIAASSTLGGAELEP